MTGPSSRGHGRRRRTHPYCVCQENRWGSGWSDQREWQRRFQLLPSGCWSQSPPHPETFRAETGKNPRVHANMELKSLGHWRGVPRAAIPMRQQRQSSFGIRATNISSCLSDEATINSLSSYFVKLQCLLRNYKNSLFLQDMNIANFSVIPANVMPSPSHALRPSSSNWDWVLFRHKTSPNYRNGV